MAKKKDETFSDSKVEKDQDKGATENKIVTFVDKAEDFNADNRRISRLLQEDRQEKQFATLRAQNRKLKHEVARLREEATGKRG